HGGGLRDPSPIDIRPVRAVFINHDEAPWGAFQSAVSLADIAFGQREIVVLHAPYRHDRLVKRFAPLAAPLLADKYGEHFPPLRPRQSGYAVTSSFVGRIMASIALVMSSGPASSPKKSASPTSGGSNVG